MKTFMHWLNENEQGFIDAIRANPDDLNLWLVYADWLEERGDPRAALIRKAKGLGRNPSQRGQRNHLGERTYQNFGAWRRAILQRWPGATFEGNKDIAQAFWGGRGVGEWDGAEGTINS